MSIDRSAGPHGILLIDKPAGWTSHDVVAKARRITHQRRIGHTGTLDPMATGLLVLCLGSATRLVEYMTLHDKHYTGEIALGTNTDTDDAEGTVLDQRPVPAVNAGRLRELERRFSGRIEQVPPAYSAIKIDGQRAYAVARKGGRVDLPARPVEIHALALSAVEPGILGTEVHCGPGTYIRSLARDIGRELGCGAHLRSLRRTSVAAFDVANAWTLAELEVLTEARQLEEVLLPPDEGIAAWAAAVAGEETVARFGHGLSTPVEAPPGMGANHLRVYSTAGAFLGVAQITPEAELRPVKVFRED